MVSQTVYSDTPDSGRRFDSSAQFQNPGQDGYPLVFELADFLG